MIPSAPGANGCGHPNGNVPLHGGIGVLDDQAQVTGIVRLSSSGRGKKCTFVCKLKKRVWPDRAIAWRFFCVAIALLFFFQRWTGDTKKKIKQI